MSSDSFGARSTLEVGGRSYEIFRLDSLATRSDVSRLPYSIKVLLENVLRLEDGVSVTAADVEAIAAWEAVRPQQPPRLDRKTGQPTTPLFLYRARPVTARFLNRSLIQVLCEKAGVPSSDARGAITSHRARATIASQLYNAKEPLTLFELQA